MFVYVKKEMFQFNYLNIIKFEYDSILEIEKEKRRVPFFSLQYQCFVGTFFKLITVKFQRCM